MPIKRVDQLFSLGPRSKSIKPKRTRDTTGRHFVTTRGEGNEAAHESVVTRVPRSCSPVDSIEHEVHTNRHGATRRFLVPHDFHRARAYRPLALCGRASL